MTKHEDDFHHLMPSGGGGRKRAAGGEAEAYGVAMSEECEHGTDSGMDTDMRGEEKLERTVATGRGPCLHLSEFVYLSFNISLTYRTTSGGGRGWG